MKKRKYFSRILVFGILFGAFLLPLLFLVLAKNFGKTWEEEFWLFFTIVLFPATITFFVLFVINLLLFFLNKKTDATMLEKDDE